MKNNSKVAKENNGHNIGHSVITIFYTHIEI